MVSETLVCPLLTINYSPKYVNANYTKILKEFYQLSTECGKYSKVKYYQLKPTSLEKVKHLNSSIIQIMKLEEAKK